VVLQTEIKVHLVHLCTLDDLLVVRNILNLIYKILSQFVKPPSDTLQRYFNMFHLAPSPPSLQFNKSDLIGRDISIIYL
jgi:hypothetical protein